MRLSSLLLTLATALPSIHAIQCMVGTLVPNVQGQIDLNNDGNTLLMSYTCPTQATGCITAYIRQAFNTEASRLVVVSCQTEHECKSETSVVTPDHWYDLRCCTGNNCNREGLNNIDWSDRTPNINQGGIPTFPSFPTIPIDNIPTDGPTNDPFTPTQATAGTQTPGTIMHCRQGTTIPAANGEIPADSSSWQSSPCQIGQTFCVTFFERTDDSKFVMGNCAETCTPSVLVSTPTRWLETTCCTGDNCNNDITKLSAHDWGERSLNTTASPIATMPPATQAPTSSSPTTQAPITTASPITGSTGPTQPTIPIVSSTGIDNIAFTTAVFSPFLVFILAVVSFVMSF